MSTPSGSTNNRWWSLSEKRTTLSSMDGQYRGPVPSISPPYMADSVRFSWINACVSGVVRVNQVGVLVILGPGVPLNVPGGSSDGTTCNTEKSTLSERMRGGVPVFRRMRSWPVARRLAERWRAGASPCRPAGRCCLPYQTTPARNVPVQSTTLGARSSRPSVARTPATRPLSTIRSAASARTISMPSTPSTSARAAAA